MKKQTILVGLFFVIVFSLVMFLLYDKNSDNNITINKTSYSLSGSDLNLDSVGVTDKEIKLISNKINDSQNIEVL